MRSLAALTRGGGAWVRWVCRHRPVMAAGLSPAATSRIALLTVLAVALIGCAARPGPRYRYAEILNAPKTPADVAVRIRPPEGECLEQARHFVARAGDILPPPLPSELHGRVVRVVRGLHPLAKQVLRHAGSIWFARDVPGADARFVPCASGEDRAGVILVDAGARLPDDVSDADVPWLYWQLIGARGPAEAGATGVRQAAPALRYVLLHELGHALSLLSGEFTLGPRQQFDFDSWDGFLAFSWRARAGRALGDELHARGGVVPSGLAVAEWRRIRRALDGPATWLAPGYRAPGPPPDSCALVERLVAAGFVTPTAAMAPTEDYAELFAHAILADERKLRADQLVTVRLPGCRPRHLVAPYFAPGLRAKRAYIERKLGL